MKKNTRLIGLMILCAVSVAVMVAALCSGNAAVEFTPPPFDPAAEAGIPQVPPGLGYQELDVGVFKVSLCGQIRPEDSAADIWLTNPAGNGVWLKLRVLDGNGNILGQTGLLRPGEYVRQVALNNTPAPGESIILKVMSYVPETYHSAGALELNTVIVPE